MTGDKKVLKARSDFIRLLWLSTFLINLFVVGMIALLVEQRREQEVLQAQTLTENYSRILEEALAGFVSKIDITLLSVRDEVTRQMAHGGIDGPALEAFIAAQDNHIPDALGLRVVDAKGIIRFAVNDVEVRNASIADRPQFIRLRDDPDAGLVFSKPVLGRAAQKWMITLGRRISNPDGSFAGDVHVAVAVDKFIEMFSRINLGTHGNIGLWDKSSLIARYTTSDTHGASVGITTPSAELRNLLNTDQRSSTLPGGWPSGRRLFGRLAKRISDDCRAGPFLCDYLRIFVPVDRQGVETSRSRPCCLSSPGGRIHS